MQAPTGDVTNLLRQVQLGDHGARSRLVSLVYDHLRRLARRQMPSRRGPQTLETSDLVHEVYLKILGQGKPEWNDRGHFFAVAARAMRQVLVDRARSRQSQRRGGHAVREPMEEGRIEVHKGADSVLVLDQALSRLAEVDERQARVVDLMFFGGFTELETAEALSITARTVQREWRAARLWLAAEIASSGREP